MLSFFECITRSSSLSTEEIKIFAIVNLISYVSDFSRLFMMSFKYDLILLRHSVFYFYHGYFHIQCNCSSKNYLLLVIYNNSLLHAQND